MPKLICTCGALISDISGFRPYKGDILPDQNLEEFTNEITRLISTFEQALDFGHKTDWIKENSSAPNHEPDRKAANLIDALIYYKFATLSRTIFQCEECGRIWIEIPGQESFAPFLPDNHSEYDILRRNE